MYDWRRMSEREREETLTWRKASARPWHSPPHRASDVGDGYLLTAACYEHRPYIGISAERLAAFERELLETLEPFCKAIQCWVVLPNHYHALVRSVDVFSTLKALGRLHGRTAFAWNTEDQARGRHVWHSAAETAIKSDRHWHATINYIHHNPVKHGHVPRWQDWPFSSAAAFLQQVGREEAEALWREYPIGEYGRGWDDL
jgi:putative transposase